MILFWWRTRWSFVLFYPGAYNGTLEDQSSSHLSAVLEMSDRYFTAHPRFVRKFFSVPVCALRTCVHVHAKAFHRFLLSTFSFSRRRWCESLVCLAMIIRSDRREALPGWCKLNRKRLLGLYIFQCGSRSLSTNHLFVWAFALVAVRFSGTSVSQSGNLFVAIAERS